ncbi:MAG: Fe-S cluster assembly sulfur transfer protein SufU [Holosporales bacterium]
MLKSTSQLYQETIINLNKNPLNYGEMTGECMTAHYHNVNCGDTVKLFVKVSEDENQAINLITFIGESCAITKASASLMTELLKGRTFKQAKNLLSGFYQLINDKEMDRETKEELKNLKIFEALHQYPSRRTCALLPWMALDQLTQSCD